MKGIIAVSGIIVASVLYAAMITYLFPGEEAEDLRITLSVIAGFIIGSVSYKFYQN